MATVHAMTTPGAASTAQPDPWTMFEHKLDPWTRACMLRMQSYMHMWESDPMDCKGRLWMVHATMEGSEKRRKARLSTGVYEGLAGITRLCDLICQSDRDLNQRCKFVNAYGTVLTDPRERLFGLRFATIAVTTEAASELCQRPPSNPNSEENRRNQPGSHSAIQFAWASTQTQIPSR